ncbi:MAG TPA: DUF1080 domain-containing protein [Candidatus Binatia bacterium]|nr:DUF1080 domain-containing protein [Candidatus Binatia bacterium]
MRLAVLLVVVVVLIGCASREPSPPTVAPAKSPTNQSPATNRIAAAPTRPTPPGAQQLFDGKTLAGWRISDFAGKGPVRVENGILILEMGTMTGVTYTNPTPTMNYEISLDAMRVEGNDFFCGLTFPVGKDPCSLIVGGWGGGVVGLSSLDGQDAANNETTQYLNFEKGRWYHIRLRVVPNKIEAWIDNDKVVDADTTDRKISIRIEVEESRPLGIATWSTTAALSNIHVRKL